MDNPFDLMQEVEALLGQAKAKLQEVKDNQEDSKLRKLCTNLAESEKCLEERKLKFLLSLTVILRCLGIKEFGGCSLDYRPHRTADAELRFITVPSTMKGGSGYPFRVKELAEGRHSFSWNHFCKDALAEITVRLSDQRTTKDSEQLAMFLDKIASINTQVTS